MINRSKVQLEHIRELVAAGSLPKSRLVEAEAELADLEDNALLARLLYGGKRLEDLTEPDVHTMIEAATRRVDREASLLAAKQKLLDLGILARTDLDTLRTEMESRQGQLSLAQSRARLIDEIHQMAATEQRLAAAGTRGVAIPAGTMIRYDGSGIFHLSDLVGIAKRFQQRFREELPVSARGQTALHQSLGLDHNERADIALNPDSVEGSWLRHYLETARLPYLAFRTAVPGAATGAHIHIGTGSTRLHVVSR